MIGTSAADTRNARRKGSPKVTEVSTYVRRTETDFILAEGPMFFKLNILQSGGRASMGVAFRPEKGDTDTTTERGWGLRIGLAHPERPQSARSWDAGQDSAPA